MLILQKQHDTEEVIPLRVLKNKRETLWCTEPMQRES